jgi:hypothetical protein
MAIRKPLLIPWGIPTVCSTASPAYLHSRFIEW